MNFVLVLFAMACLVFVLAACRGGKPAEPRVPPPDPAIAGKTDPVVAGRTDPGLAPGSLAREDILRMLRNLADDPAPTTLEPGAMCYEVAGSPSRAEYVCPRCGSKTLYARDGGDRKVDGDVLSCVSSVIVECRRRIGQVEGLGLELDETRFCRACSPDTDEPLLGLVVRFRGQEKPHRVWGVSVDDIGLLADFAAGGNRHTYTNDAQTPLKEHLPRIRELLGVQ